MEDEFEEAINLAKNLGWDDLKNEIRGEVDGMINRWTIKNKE